MVVTDKIALRSVIAKMVGIVTISQEHAIVPQDGEVQCKYFQDFNTLRGKKILLTADLQFI